MKHDYITAKVAELQAHVARWKEQVEEESGDLKLDIKLSVDVYHASK